MARAGAPLTVVGSRDRWRQVDLEGWIWALSVGPTGAGSLQVDAGDGENLRAEPNGAILARLEPGAVLDELGRRERWVRVRRRAWIWAPSLSEPRAEPAVRSAPESQEAAAGAKGSAGSLASWVVPEEGVALRAQPDSTRVGTLEGGTTVEVLERRGGWARVRHEGWVPVPEAGEAPGEQPLTGVAAVDLARDPERFAGRRLAWTVQFISLERAERIRTEFYEGEPYVLARGPGEGRPIVYLAVPPELLAAVEALEALDRLDVVGRVRTPRSPLTGAPVLDLQEIR
ncbi:MAG: SH3 domain-containing protein [Gemmatimonadota bacterium]